MEMKNKIEIILIATLLSTSIFAVIPWVRAVDYLEYPDLSYYGWMDDVWSLRVNGQARLYYDPNCTGSYVDFTTDQPDLYSSGWRGLADSLRVSGSVTLYSMVGYGGKFLTFSSDTSVPCDNIGTLWNQNPNLVSPDYWAGHHLSWNLGGGQSDDPDTSEQYARWVSSGLVILRSVDLLNDPWLDDALYEQGNHGSYVNPFQPNPVMVKDLSSLTLEAWISNVSLGSSYAPSWNGAKFDVWLDATTSTNPYVSSNGHPLFFELYFMRTGNNLLWPDDGGREWSKHLDGGAYHNMYAMDYYPDWVDITAYPGSTFPLLYRINLLPFIDEACGENIGGLDINSLYVKKIGVSLECAWEGMPAWAISCDLHRLRLGYTLISSTQTSWRSWGSVPEDANGDLQVNVLDAIAISQIYNSNAGDVNYNVSRDLNLDGHINVLDCIIMSSNFDSYGTSRKFQGYACQIMKDGNLYGMAWAKLIIKKTPSTGTVYFNAAVAYTLFEQNPYFVGCSFVLGSEASGMSGTPDVADALIYQTDYFRDNEGVLWHGKGYWYWDPIPVILKTHRFEMSGSLTGSSTYTGLYLTTTTYDGYGQSFFIVNY